MSDNTHNLSDALVIPEHIREVIPSGLRPDLTAGLALWLAGHSTHEASRISGCPQTTLWEHARALPQSVKDGRAKYAEAVEDILYPIIKEAYSQLGERMATERLKVDQLNFIAGTAVDKAIGLQRLRQQANTPASGLESLLGKLVDSGGGTITVEPHRTIDVTPKEDSE
jgi:hypothetical protein